MGAVQTAILLIKSKKNVWSYIYEELSNSTSKMKYECTQYCITRDLGVFSI